MVTSNGRRADETAHMSVEPAGQRGDSKAAITKVTSLTLKRVDAEALHQRVAAAQARIARPTRESSRLPTASDGHDQRRPRSDR